MQLLRHAIDFLQLANDLVNSLRKFDENCLFIRKLAIISLIELVFVSYATLRNCERNQHSYKRDNFDHFCEYESNLFHLLLLKLRLNAMRDFIARETTHCCN